MAWELPPSITRALDRFAISRPQRLEGEDSIVPTVGMLSLDQPPFRQEGRRFFGGGVSQVADLGGTCMVLSTSNRRCAVVVDSIVLVADINAMISIALEYVALIGGGIPVFIPETQQRLVTTGDLRITPLLTQLSGSRLYQFPVLAGTVVQLRTEILLPLLPHDGNSVINLAVNTSTNLATIHVSFAGRVWYSEE